MKRKPIEMIKNKNTPLIKMEDELSTLVQFQENIMAQIIDRQDEAHANFLINQIIAFMDENNVSTCFVLNKEELIDCLQEHNKLHYKILNLQSQLDQANERLKGAIIPKFKIGQEVWFISDPDVDVYRKVRHIKVEDISISSFFTERGIMYSGGDWAGLSENELFATKEEAKKKLQELRGGE